MCAFLKINSVPVIWLRGSGVLAWCDKRPMSASSWRLLTISFRAGGSVGAWASGMNSGAGAGAAGGLVLGAERDFLKSEKNGFE